MIFCFQKEECRLIREEKKLAMDNKDVDVIQKTLTNEQVLKEEISNNAKREPVTVVIKSK